MVLELITWMLAALFGAIAHEVAHWLVWALAGRRPQLDLWELTVRPRAGSTRTTAADRVAAAAPYAIATVVVLVGLEASSWHAIIFGAFMFQLPSTSDVQTVLGRSEWIIHTQDHA